MKLSLLPQAQAEFFGAIGYYDGQRSGLGEAFRSAVDEALQTIMLYPLGCALPIWIGRILASN